MYAQRHYANHLHANYVNYPFGLYCYDALPSAGEPVFKFSDPNVLYTVNGVYIRGSVTYISKISIIIETICIFVKSFNDE
jgi:hypothetical protein